MHLHSIYLIILTVILRDELDAKHKILIKKISCKLSISTLINIVNINENSHTHCVLTSPNWNHTPNDIVMTPLSNSCLYILLRVHVLVQVCMCVCE